MSTRPAQKPDTERRTLSDYLALTNDYLSRQPGFDYLMIRIIVLFLVGLGVVMVFSSSMTSSVSEGGTVFSEALRQTMMVAVGLVAFWTALKVPLRLVRRAAPWLMWVTLALLIVVLIPGIGTGRESVGSQSWIAIGSFSLQPSELAKVVIAIWGACHLAGQRHVETTLRSPFVQFIAVAVLWFVLIVAQGDLGMAMSFAIVVGFTLIFAGIQWKFIVVALVMVVAGLATVFISGGFRSDRFHTYFDALTGNFSNTRSTAFQSHQGFLSLADGSFAGVGLGQSRAKWFYLPEAKNDFIFAVIGEELGLWGGVLVILLFAGLAYFGIRTARRAQNQFQALLAAALTMSVVSQAFINIGYVIGLLPVTGIQLPMISAGGTSAIITIGSMGLLASVARHEPEAVSAMQSYGRPLFDRFLFLGEPAPEAEESLRPGMRIRPQTRRDAPRATPVTARSSATRRPGSVGGPRNQAATRSQPASRSRRSDRAEYIQNDRRR